MRPLEIVLILVAAAATIRYLTGHRHDLADRAVGAAPGAIAAVQLVVEGSRWQLVPAYGVALLLAARTASAPLSPPKRPRLRMAGWIAGVGLTLCLPTLLPIPGLPSPTGPYAVGTATTLLVDDSRAEIYGPSPGGARQIPVHVWYPAADTAGSPPGWLATDVTRVVADEFGLPPFFLDHLSLTQTHAVVDAPVVEGADRFPVVVYSHGWTGFGRISPDQPERLASEGFIVVAPDHTYGAMVAELPSGLVRYDPAALPDEEDVDEATYERASRTLVSVYAADLGFVVDSLASLDAGIGLHTRMDLDRIGIFGHSTGGGAAVAACHSDDRCDAVAGLDPWVEPVADTVISTGLAQPFLAMRSDGWVGEDNDARLMAMHRAGSAPSEIVALVGANHYDFVALSQISPLAGVLGFKGPIPAATARSAIGSFLVDFFDRTLRSGSPSRDTFDVIRIDEIRRHTPVGSPSPDPRGRPCC